MTISIFVSRQIREAAFSANGFAKHFVGIELYPYQEEAAEAIVHSAIQRDGNTFVLVFSRQSGKDETLAITARLTGLFSLKASNTIRYANAPVSGFTTTDTITAIALVAKF